MTTSSSLPTATSTETPATPEAQPRSRASAAERKQTALPVLEQLFSLYPHLFGAEFLPLKRGIFQDLLARHPDVFQRDSLKAALAFHARSTRYLQCVASGKARHDLDGAAVEDVALEHVVQAQVELHRRRQARTQELDDALSESAAKIARQEALFKAFEASGKSAREFADMYGVPERDVIKAGLACKRRAQAGAVEA